MKFRKKPIVIDTILWAGGNTELLDEFCGNEWGRADAKGLDNFEEIENVVVYNKAERQWINVPVGHWIIRGIEGEYYPCKPDIFEKTYEAVN